MAAQINVGRIVQASAMPCSRSVALKFKEFSRTRRQIYITAAFKEERPTIADIVGHMFGRVVKPIVAIDEFAAAKHKATVQKNSASVIALISASERHVFHGVQHALTLREYIDFSNHCDWAQSCPGL